MEKTIAEKRTWESALLPLGKARSVIAISQSYSIFLKMTSTPCP
jgi:hypothetical protein